MTKDERRALMPAVSREWDKWVEAFGTPLSFTGVELFNGMKIEFPAPVKGRQLEDGK